MHILIVHQAFASIDEPGGTRHYETARYFARKGHKVTVIASPISYLTGKSREKQKDHPDIENLEPGITIIRSYTYSALHRSFFHRVFSFLSFMISSFWAGLQVPDVDLVWGTSPPIFQGVTAWLLSRLKKIPFLFEIRDLWPAFAIAIGVLRNPILIQCSLWLERFLYRHADEIVINSPGFSNHLQSLGIEHYHIIPNGADINMFSFNDSAASFRQSIGLRGSDFVVLYAGAHGISNDLNVILDTAKRVENQPEIQFVMIGDGKEKQNLIQYAKQLNLHNIQFLPPASKSEMSQVLAASDICIAILKPIELYKTTFPNKVFDYMAAGKPVLLAIDGVIREVVEKAGGGIFAPPGDSEAITKALLYFHDHPSETRKMGISAREFIKNHFNRDKLSEDFLTILESMVNDE